MRIEFLYWEECPSHEEALARLREVLASEGVEAEIEIRRIETEEQAQAERFIGSPTIRINGIDIDPTAERQTFYSLTCRAYTREDGRISPLPPVEMIRRAVQAARAQEAARPARPRS